MTDSITKLMARAMYDYRYPDKHNNPCWEAMPENAQDTYKGWVGAALQAAEQAGYAIVPVEPTEEMAEAGRLIDDSVLGSGVVTVYKAMIAARPKETSSE